MRICITLNADGEIVLPVQYNHILQGFLYRNISDRDYCQFLHFEKKGGGANNHFKMFTFSRIMGKFLFNKDEGKITFFPPAKIIISSGVEQFVQDLMANLTRAELCFLGQNEVEISSIEIEEEPHFEEKMRIKMLSPVVACTTGIREGRKYTSYYSPWQPQFEELTTNNLISKYRLIHGENPPGTLLKVIPNGSREKKFEKILNYKGTVIRGYAGIYWLKGCPELMKIAYETGLGFKSSQGFGCWEIFPCED